MRDEFVPRPERPGCHWLFQCLCSQAKVIPRFSESVATLRGIASDMVSVFSYFSRLFFTKEGDHARTGRISSGSDRRNHAC